ncbi:MAG: DUF5050 domain-containing protein, partial [Bifidobacteriaceae bacterium]|nr:DUF5050 domain-containing protein [Bifidobacteriaceae bacterium]
PVDAEQAILARLDAPGIPKVYGALTQGGRAYLAREHFDGMPLDQVLARGTLPPSRVRAIGRQLCGLLSYLHSQTPPVVHRDIKPQNIILCPDGSVGLTDFGIARVFKDSSTSDTQHMGTMPYAPPEQYGYAQSSPQADIYALGVVLIFLATGSPDRADLALRIPDAGLRRVIERCIAFDPRDRFQNVEQVARRLRPPLRERHGLLWAFAACVATVALVLAGVGFSRGWPWAEPGLGALGGPKTPSGATQTGVGPYEQGLGNLPGNIVSGRGLVVEGGGFIYLAAAHGIYQLGMDGTDAGRLVASEDADSLNYWEGDVYYASYTEGIVRCDPGTGDCVTLVDESAGDLFIDGGQLYFELVDDDFNLYKMAPDGSGMELVNPRTGYYPLVYRGFHYFTDFDDGDRLYRTDLASGRTDLVYDAATAWLCTLDDTLFLSDFTVPGALVAADLDGAGAKRIYSGAVSRVVAYSGGLVFINGHGKLVRSDLDGGGEMVLTENPSDTHAIAGDWVFYHNTDDGAAWMVRLDGTDDHFIVNRF